MWLLICLLTWQGVQAAKPAALTDEDKALFEKLFREGLFDPKEAVWTKLTVKREFNRQDFSYSRQQWRKGKRYYLCNGTSYEDSTLNDAIAADITELAKERLAKITTDGISSSMRYAGGIPNPPNLAIAAWCYRAGKDQVAAELLQQLRHQLSTVRVGNEPTDVYGKFHWDLEWISYAGMVHAFQDHQDALALSHGEQLEKHFTHGLQRFPQAKDVIADLRRRQKEGTFGKPAADKLPEEYAKYSVEEKIKFLIKDFQEIDEHQMMQPGGVALSNNFRVREMAKLGEAALPALFDCIEKDQRMVRVVSYWRDFHPTREVHYVAEAAWDAVYMILKTIPASHQGIDYQSPPLQRYRAMGAAAKKYWEAHRSKSPEQRHYETLCDLKNNSMVRSSAVVSLVTEEQHPSWFNHEAELYWPKPPASMKASLDVFKNPTVAEALWFSLDHDTRPREPNSKKGVTENQNHSYRYELNEIQRSINRAENHFLAGLVALGDRRAMPEMLKRVQDKKNPFRLRLKLAQALHLFGDPNPLAGLAQQIAAGEEPKGGFPMPPSNEHWDISTLEATLFIRTLTQAELPETDAALMAIARKKNHPLHEYFAIRLRPYARDTGRASNYYSHPYCMVFYREWLKDTSPSGTVYQISTSQRNKVEEENLSIRTGDMNIGTGVHGIIKERAMRLDSVESRVCDDTMLHLSRMIIGMPEYHPLRKDAQALFDRNMEWLNTHVLRRKNLYEAYLMGSNSSDQTLIPDLKPLRKPATLEDVHEGRAAFSLTEPSELLDLKLPAWVVLKKDVQGTYIRRRGLIVQAETASGKKHYGVLFNDGIREVKDEEIEKIEVYDPEKIPR